MTSFLDTMFGPVSREAWLEWGTFNGKIFNRSGCGRVKDREGMIPDDEAVFYSAALLKPGTARSDANVDKVMVLTIDDVGTKIDLDAMEMLAPVPTAKVETSQGNFQWQYAIKGGVNPDLYRMLRQEMKQSPIWGHSEAIAPSNLIRLPHGVNGKPNKVAWKVTAGTLCKVYEFSELAQAFGNPSQGSGAPGRNGRPDQIASEGLLYSLVKRIPNDRPDRQRWVDVAHAIHGASNGTGHETFFVWAEGWTCGVDDPAENQRLWDSISSPTIGRGWLLREAGLAGEDWLREEAKVVFDDGVKYEEPPIAPIPLVAVNGKRKLPRRAWLYDNRLIRGYLSSTIAAGGIGKTALTIAEAVAMVSGTDLLKVGEERMPRSPLRVLVWNGEDPLEELERRLQGIMKHYSVTDADMGGRLFMLSGLDHPLYEKKRRDAFIATIKAHKIDVVILDPFVSTHRESENDNVRMDAIAKGWSGVAQKCFCAVDLVHHIRKPANGIKADPTTDDARGASAVVNASRYARVISPMPESIAAQYRITNRKAYIAIQKEATKANMVPGMVGTDWYHHANVEIDNGEPFPDAGAPIKGDEVGVVERWFPGVGLMDDVAKIVAAQTEIAKSDFRASSQSAEWVGHPIVSALGLDPKDPFVKGLIKEWLRKGWLKSVRKLDSARHEREFIEVGDIPQGETF